MVARVLNINLLSHICRIVAGAVFAFSGFVKAVDPWGTALKVNEYLSIYGLEFFEPASMVFSIWLCGAELMMGLMLLFKVRTRLVSIFALLSMIFFTALTFLSATWIPVEDCGCFGDALKLSPWATFFKNLILLPMVVVVWWRYRPYRAFAFSRREIALTALFCALAMGVGTYCYFTLPLIDFLPYKKGANIYEMVNAQHYDGKEHIDEEAYVLIYRNRLTGKLSEFRIDDTEWQDEEKWEWVDTRVENEMPNIQALVSEFCISDAEGDATEEILTHSGMVYMLCVTSFEGLSARCAERLRGIVERAEQEESLVVCLTPEPLDGVYWHSFAGSAEVRCYNIDATVMKTMLRAKCGLVVLEDGVIQQKKNCTML